MNQPQEPVTDAIEQLRLAITHASAADDAELRAALDASPFARGDVERGPSGPVGHAWVELRSPLKLGLLELRYGPAHRGPAPHPGVPRTVQFNSTLPLEGSVGGTVLAELDDAGHVVRVLVRRDAF